MAYRIYTVTPNPALDVSGEVKSLIPNEKNYVFNERRDPGGNGINAARIISRLGEKAIALGFLGGATGSEISARLKEEKVKTRFTKIRANNRTNVTVCNEESGSQTRLTFPGPDITSSEVRVLLNQIRTLPTPGLYVIGGSLPKGAPETLHLDLARTAAKRGLGVVIDVPSKYLKNILARPGFKPLLLKPNQIELEEWYGQKLQDDGALIKAGKAMAKKASLVCISLASRGAMLVTQNRAWFASPPKIKARGTVGAGDSMVGSMVSALARHRLATPEAIESLLAETEGETLPPPLKDMLIWGLAGGAATAQVSGTQLADPAEIRRLMKQVKIQPLA